MRSVKLVTENVDGGNSFDVILCAEVRRQKATKLHQCVMALQKADRIFEHVTYFLQIQVERRFSENKQQSVII